MTAENDGTQQPQQAGSENSFSCSLVSVFACQLILIVGAFSGITAMFVVTQNDQINSSVRSIATKSVQSAANYVSNPLTYHHGTAVLIANVLRASPTQLQNRHLNMSNLSAHGLQFGVFRSVLLRNAFAAYSYNTYDTGVPSTLPGADGFNAFTESAVLHGRCDTTDEAGVVRYMDVADTVVNDPTQFNYSITQTDHGNLIANASYAKAAMRSNLTTDVWTAPYLWVGVYTSILLSFYQCLEPNLTSGGCRNTYGQDLDIGYILTIIGSFGSTPSSTVSLIDLRGMLLLATSDDIDPLDSTNSSWPATASPSVLSNAGAAWFINSCPVESGCTIVVDTSGSEHVFAGIRIAPFDGVQMALIDVSPRSYYFDAADASARVAIAVVVVVSFMAAACCVLTFLGIARPVMALIEGFLLAADLRNEDVVPVASRIREMSQLSAAFSRMNAKLLAARAFMPQSMLSTNGDEEPDEGDVTFATDSDGASSFSHHSKSRRSQSVAKGDSASGSMAPSHGASSSQRSGGLAHQNMEGGLVDKKCTVLIVNIVHLHKAIDERRMGGIERDFAKWLEVVQAAVKAEKGVVDSYHGDRIVLTFNSSNCVAAHARRAAMCAIAIARASEKTTFPVVSMGLATGRALTGALGTSSLRAFVTLGPCFTNAGLLERLARQMAARYQSPTIFCTDVLAEEISNFVHVFLVGRSSRSNLRAYAVAAPIERSADDEWLYEIQQSAKRNPFSDISAAVGHIMDGNVAAASQLIQEQGTVEVTTTAADMVRSMVNHGWDHTRRMLMCTEHDKKAPDLDALLLAV